MVPTLATGNQYRLNEDVRPTHYKLVVKTDLDAKPDPTFEGAAEIDLDVHNTVNSITFHAAAPLKLHYATVGSASLQTDPVQVAQGIEHDTKYDRCTVTFASKLLAGTKARLGLRWAGTLDGSMMGYYKAIYEDGGEKRLYALTQFEPTAARKAFPCWDEPALKATFDVSLITRKNTVALANTSKVSEHASDGSFPEGLATLPAVIPEHAAINPDAIEKSPTGKGSTKPVGTDNAPIKKTPPESARATEWVISHYETTPKMSTYLVAFANGEFEHIEGTYTSPLTGKKMPVRLYATKDNIKQAELCLEASLQVLPVYEKIFDIPYPLSKLDTLVASDFDAGAMENWGLITCRTSVGLYDKSSGIAAKKRTVSVQSHEIAHQWFGNIVTMFWWEELWLNEAFATLMGEVISINEIYPEWNLHAEFINAHLRRALSLDSKRSSHPIQVPCPDPEMINQIFDAISYSKGASVLKMLSNLVGEKVFLKGVSIYLKARLYGNGTTDDLWAGISEASGLNIAKIMEAWTLKIGFPVITVTESPSGLTVKQNRFLSTGDPTPEEDETLWYVPLQLKTVDKQGNVSVKSDAILAARETHLNMPDVSDTVYKLNAETCGVYRVNYPPERLAKLGAEAARPNSVLSLSDRMGLVQDAIILAASGYASTSGALELISQMGNEPEYLVWSEIIDATSSINHVWWEQPKSVRQQFHAFERSLYSPLAKKLGLSSPPDDSEDRIQLRVKAISAAIFAKDQEVIEDAKKRFDLFVSKNDESGIDGDLRNVIYKTGVQYGGKSEYEKMLEVYRKPATPAHKIAAMLAMCASRDQELMKRTLDFILSDNVKIQDYMYFFSGLSANELGRRPLWEFLKANLDQLLDKFKGNFSLGRLIQITVTCFTSYEDKEAVEAFFKTKETQTFSQPLAQALDSVQASSAWLARSKQDVEDWLRSKQFSG